MTAFLRLKPLRLKAPVTSNSGYNRGFFVFCDLGERKSFELCLSGALRDVLSFRCSVAGSGASLE